MKVDGRMQPTLSLSSLIYQKRQVLSVLQKKEGETHLSKAIQQTGSLAFEPE